MSSKRESSVKSTISDLEDIRLSVDGSRPGDDTVGELSEALDCLRLWFAIRTDVGRKRALDALSRIVEDEQR
jgi:hypothetical protein